jgi:hypothetical protein
MILDHKNVVSTIEKKAYPIRVDGFEAEEVEFFQRRLAIAAILAYVICQCFYYILLG